MSERRQRELWEVMTDLPRYVPSEGVFGGHLEFPVRGGHTVKVPMPEFAGKQFITVMKLETLI